MGRTILGTYDCLADHYLGADGKHYSTLPEISSWQYSDIKSYVDLQQYGLQLNVNLLGIFNRTRDSRWRVEIAPMLSAYGTDADLHGAKQLNKGTKWHLGVGGNVQVGYWFTNHFGLAIYTEGNHLTGSRLDGIPKFRFINNFVGESGIKFAFGFGKSKKAEPVQVVEPVAEPVQVVEPEKPVVVKPKPAPVVETPKAKEFEFRNVLFDVNKDNIKDSEKGKISEATEYLKNNTEKQVKVTGWTDPTGSEKLNKDLSNRRAKSVKQALVNGGIDASRISTEGKGVMTEAGSNYEQARAAVIKEVK
jgi:outer membrane protein OmpA-like peptidoglycan-associated protein